MVERVWRNGTLLHCAGMQICVATMENGMEVPPKAKNQSCNMIQQSHSWAYIQTKLQKDTCPYVHSSTIHNSQDREEPKRPSTDEWIKVWYIYTTEYYSAIKGKREWNNVILQLHGWT